jgi:hypothetical protein
VLGSSRVAAQLAASREGLSSMKLVDLGEMQSVSCAYLVKHQAMNIWGIGVLGSLSWPRHRGEWSASRLDRFTPEKNPRYPLGRRLDWPQRRSGRLAEDKNLALPGIEPQAPASRSSLYRLSYLDSIHECNWNKSLRCIMKAGGKKNIYKYTHTHTQN